MAYQVFAYNKDKLYNDSLRDKLSKSGVRFAEITLAWQEAFDYVAAMTATPLPSNHNLVVMGRYRQGGPFKVDATGNFYSVVIKAFGHLVIFRYNQTLNRVSFRYKG